MSTIDKEEVEKFSKLANAWWDEQGEFAILHKMNPVRIKYIKDLVKNYTGKDLADLSLLDIGCGGGLLAVPMARLGADVTAIDVSEENIEAAKLHIEAKQIDINYLCKTAEELAEEGQKFDIITALELIEHVSDPALLVASCKKLLNDKGLLFISTINRNLKSYGMAIIAAEYILKLTPKGTHDWHKFVKPSELDRMITENDMQLREIAGMEYSPVKKQWRLSKDVSVNYIICAQ